MSFTDFTFNDVMSITISISVSGFAIYLVNILG